LSTKFLDDLLLAVEVGIEPPSSQELGVIPHSDESAPREDGDAVRTGGNGGAVSDEDAGLLSADFPEFLEDGIFGREVNAGEGIVQHKHGGIPHKGPGKSDTRSLPPRQGDTPLPH
jgi:hypothetical protein